MDSLKEAYSILGVDSDSTLEQIEKVYWEKFEEIVSEKIFNRALLNQIKNAYDQITKDRRLKEPPSNANMDVINDNERFENENVNMEIDTVDSFDSIKSNEQFNHSYYDDINTNGLDNKHETEENDCEMIEEKSKEIENSTKKCPPPIEHKLFVTLEELKRGCLKTEMVIRQIFQNGKALIEKKPIRVKIKIGTKIGETIIVEEKGHQWENCDIKGDIHFIVQALPHNYFRPLNIIDLECIVNITMTQLNSGFNLDIPSLDSNGPINFEWKGTIINFHDEMLDTIKKRGLPYLDGNQRKMGDLIVKYDLVSEQAMRDGITKLKKVNKDDSNFIENSKSEFDIFMTLDDVMFGAKKEFTINQKVEKNNSCETEEKTFLIEIPPGAKSNSTIIFEKQGDILKCTHAPLDVVFILRDEKDQKFERDGTDLVYRTQVTREQVDKGEVVNIPQIGSKEPLSVVLDNSVIQEGKIFYGRGLPYPIDQRSKGCLIVRFELVNQVIQYEKSDKLPTNRYDLELSLKELFTGCKQTLPVVRKKLDGTFETIQKEVDVEAGTLNGTIIYFENEGDQEEGLLPADLEYVIVQIEDPIYKVRDYDLEISSSIDEQQAKNGCELNVPTIEGTEIPVYFEPGVTTRTTKRIPNYGLLKPDKTRGDLVIRFDTIFKLNKDKPIIRPLSLTLEQIQIGLKRKVQINRKVYNFRKNCSELKCEFATIIIPPGAPDKYEFVFENFADESKGSMPGDLIYVVQEKPHDFFKRDGANLLYCKKIYECLLCRPISIPRLGMNEPIVFLIEDDFNRKNPNKRFGGCGLPKMNEESKNGDLIVQLDIMHDPSTPEYPLWLSLEDVMNGVENKQIDQIERLFINVDGSQEKRKETVNVSIEPGIENGAIITIPWAEEENESFVAFDINLKVQDKPHSIFERSGADIIYKMKVSQSECNQDSLEFDIPTLDGKLRNETFTKICKTNLIKRIANAGLPKPGSKQFGDLIVKFEIVSNNLKDASIIHEVSIPLEDFFCGTKKRMKIKRLIRSIDGRMQDQEKIIELDILPGHKPGHDFKFIRMGDEHKGRIPADVIFKVFAKPHEHFKANGYNLFYSHKVNRSEIDKGNYTFMVPTLDGDPIEQTIPSRLRNKTIKINGYGLPKMSFKPSIRGDIVVNLDINEDSVSNKRNKKQNSKEAIDKHTKDVEKTTQMSPIENEKESVDKVSNSTKPPIIINMPVTIEQVMTGTIIEKEFVQEIMNENSQIINKITKLYKIEIEPGCIAGTKHYFRKEGHRYGNEPSDLIFVIVDVPHPQFVRKAMDLEYTAKVHDGMIEVQIPVFDKGQLSFITIPVKKPGEYEFIENFGLPNPAEAGKRGLLIVKFIFDPNYQSENINPIQNMVRNGDSVLNFLYSEALKRNTPNQNGFQSSYNLESSFPSVQYNNNYKSNQNIMVKAGCVNTGTPFSYSDAAKQIVDFPKSINPKNSPNYSFNNINSISNNSGMVENNSLKRVKEIDLFLSLEEVLNGCTKEKLLNRKIVEEDQYEHIEEKQFKIDIAPGIVENERITFKNAGDQLYGQEADDIVFVVKMEEHPIFKRNGANIIMSYKSDRKNAGKTVTLPKLDKPGHFKTKAPKHSNECTNYPGLGLPHPDKPVRGMLIVNWIFFGESKKFWFNKYF